MQNKIIDTLKRYILLIIALFILALGVALSVKANLGTSPISCVPYVISLFVPLTMGQVTIIMHIVFILIQIILLRKDFELIQLLQLPVAFIFGYFTDFTIWLLSFVKPESYPTQWVCAILSFILIGLGVFLEVHANAIVLSGEGMMLAIAKTFNLEFSKVKIGVDVTQVTLGIIISFVALHGLFGIREGSIAAAILVGVFVKFFNFLKDSISNQVVGNI